MGVKSPLHSAFFLLVKPFAVTFVEPPILFILSIFSLFPRSYRVIPAKAGIQSIR